MNSRDRLLGVLADGRFHSGQQLADALGVSRTAIWKQVQRIGEDYGIAIDAVRGRGYRLPRPLEMLDPHWIQDAVEARCRGRLAGLCCRSVSESTNAEALDDLPGRVGEARVYLAEHQTAGRGRRGRPWISTFGENLYLSFAWRFELPLSALAGLSLMSGVVVAETLQRQGVGGHRLKWPNDVHVDGRKLCGILVEATGEAAGPSDAVIGMGINFRVSAAASERIDQPWVDLHSLGATDVSRNRVAVELIVGLIESCMRFSAEGLEPFIDRWRVYDTLVDKPVRITGANKQVDGVYRGVAANGAVRIETGAGLREYHAGEVSLRTGGAG